MQKGKQQENLEHQKKMWKEYDSYVHNPQKSITCYSQQLGLSKLTRYDVMHKILRLYAYKIQMLYAIKLDNKVYKVELAVNMLQRFDDEPEFLVISSSWRGNIPYQQLCKLAQLPNLGLQKSTYFT